MIPTASVEVEFASLAAWGSCVVALRVLAKLVFVRQSFFPWSSTFFLTDCLRLNSLKRQLGVFLKECRGMFDCLSHPRNIASVWQVNDHFTARSELLQPDARY